MEPTAQHMPQEISKDKTQMPDISHEARAAVEGELEKVGMGDIEMPILWQDVSGRSHLIPSRIDAFVNLNQPKAKGIHMSRLYLALQKGTTAEPLSLVTLKKILLEFVDSQKGLSDSAYVKVKFDLPIMRKALVSSKTGWRQYPVCIEARLLGRRFEFVVSGEVLYSSTCPCSAALARQLISEKFQSEFNGSKELSVSEVAAWLSKDSSIMATPHAQRSTAKYSVRLKEGYEELSPLGLIDLIEGALATPVQAAVKREDEQEFARLNGENLMFCEDAGRKVKSALERDERVAAYQVRLTHHESLHPHDAVSEIESVDPV